MRELRKNLPHDIATVLLFFACIGRTCWLRKSESDECTAYKSRCSVVSLKGSIFFKASSLLPFSRERCAASAVAIVSRSARNVAMQVYIVKKRK